MPTRKPANAQQLPACLRTVQLIHSAELLGPQRSVSVRALEQALAHLTPSGRVERVTGADISDATRRVQTDTGGLLQLDPQQWPEAMNTPALQPFRSLIRPLHIRQVSNTLGHLAALQAASKSCEDSTSTSNGDDAWSLVIEDDALYNGDQGIERVVRDAPPDADVIMLGLPSARAASKDACVFDDMMERFQLLPACESYLVRGRAARALVSAFLPIRLPTAAQLTLLMRHLGLRVLVAVPNVFVDGSKFGVFTSSLEMNNRLLWNQPHCILEALLKSGAYDRDAAGAAKEAQAAWDAQPFKAHPDALGVWGMHLAKQGRCTQAETAFAQAYEAYTKEGCLLNQTSEFLKAYVAVYRDLQSPVTAPPPGSVAPPPPFVASS